MSAFSKTKKALLTGLATFALGGVMLATTSDSADARSRGWGGGGHFRSVGWGGGGFRHAGGWGGRGYYGGRGYGFRRGYGGGALAAGLIGGLAVGAIAASSPYYGYGYDYGYPGYGYGYAPVSYYGGECVVERRVTISPWGERIVRREQVCY